MAWIACAVLVTAMAEPETAEPEMAEPETAEAGAVQRAEQAYEANDFQAAADAFGQAYVANPLPRYLWAQAQAERLAGDCASAVVIYDRFLATGPAPKDEQDARDAKTACEKQLAADEPPVHEPVAPASAHVDEPEPAAAVAQPTEPPMKWYRDPWGGALAGSGVFVGGIGAGLLASAVRLDRNASGASTEGAYETSRNDAVVRQRVGIATLAVGGALVVAGAVRWALVGTRSKRAQAAFVPAGPGVIVVGRF